MEGDHQAVFLQTKSITKNIIFVPWFP